MRALILAPFADRYLRRLRRSLEVVHDSWTESRRLHSPEELAARLRQEEASVLVVEADFVFDEVFEAVPALRLVGVCRNAFHQVDVDAASERGVLVVHTPARNAIAVAELTLALMLALARHLVLAHRLVIEGRWPDPVEPYFTFQGRELAGSVVGIIGLGHVGQEVAARLRCLRARVLAYDPYVPPRRMRALGVTPAGLADLVRRSDFVTIHAVQTEGSEGLVDEALLRLMKPQAYLINTGAAAVVDSTALVRCLEEGRIAGATLDLPRAGPRRRRRLPGLLPSLVKPGRRPAEGGFGNLLMASVCGQADYV